ncbi:hypothetical protein GCM10009127_21540 [Alteraurantiacibacter aestuarii]|uniref:hydrolase 1, exosortase A system-associated n=1 Tax=Alteraurantiacibacter aestuarii TaxID=650004 RepID=UPI0031DB4234
MSRRHFTFPCAGEELAATLDDANGAAGLLLVTGGNETRAGAFSGQAQLAARIAAAGYPVMRFDRRGVGDSSGENCGFEASHEDIAAAISAFRDRKPGPLRIVGFGNCDAASALMLMGGAGCDALILANPWTFDADDADAAPPPAAIRSRYAAKLRNPRELVRLVTGGVSLAKLAGGLRRALSPPPPPSSLVELLRGGMRQSTLPATYLVAQTDRTGQAFMAACPESKDAWQICENAGHSFSEPHARDWLFNQLLATLEEQARQLDMG